MPDSAVKVIVCQGLRSWFNTFYRTTNFVCSKITMGEYQGRHGLRLSDYELEGELIDLYAIFSSNDGWVMDR